MRGAEVPPMLTNSLGWTQASETYDVDADGKLIVTILFNQSVSGSAAASLNCIGSVRHGIPRFERYALVPADAGVAATLRDRGMPLRGKRLAALAGMRHDVLRPLAALIGAQQLARVAV